MTRRLLALAAFAALCGTERPSAQTAGFGAPDQSAAPALTPANIALAADWRGFCPFERIGVRVVHDASHPELQNSELLSRAMAERTPEMRRLAFLAIGRKVGQELLFIMGVELMNTRGEVSDSSRVLADSDASVRREAANAIAQAASQTAEDLLYRTLLPRGFDLAPPGATTRLSDIIRSAYEHRLVLEKDPGVVGALLENLARIPISRATDLVSVEKTLVKLGIHDPTEILGAASGLNALVSRDPTVVFQAPTLDWLRSFAAGISRPVASATPSARQTVDAPDVDARIRRVAILTLQALHDNDATTLVEAIGDPDWQVRRTAVQMMTADELSTLADNRPLGDAVFQVRLAALDTVGHVHADAACDHVLTALRDEEPAVVQAAVGLIPMACEPARAPRGWLVARARDLGASAKSWLLGVAALRVLARVDPEDAREMLRLTASQEAWQVRVAAADAAATLKEEPMLIALAGDRNANVRIAALQGLSRLESPSLGAAARSSLASDDLGLVEVAATLLATTSPDPSSVDALVAALGRLSAASIDSSRAARVAILKALSSSGTQDVAPLTEVLQDFDPVVAEAAAAAVGALTGHAGAASADPHRRVPYQPTLDELNSSPTHARINLDDGTAFELSLETTEAPVTVARFVSLARRGFYEDTTFFDVDPGVSLRGGGRGDNAAASDTRFWRNEVGTLPHVRGAVGIWDPGRDIGGGQLTIDLVDHPSLNHAQTVFAHVTSDLGLVDRFTVATKIKSIEFW